MLSLTECIELVYTSYLRAQPLLKGYDSETRDYTGVLTLFQLAGIPLSGIPAISITGSKGKGSTSLLCAAMLQSMGHKVGLVMSPHLVDFVERIRFDGRVIPESDFVRIMNDLAPAINQVAGGLAGPKYLGPNGLILACAIRYFIERGATAMVLEVGRGGRFDEITIYQNLVTCLTPIMGEHLDKLGPTLQDVAWNKAGLIKPHSTVITAPQQSDVDSVIQSEADTKQARLLRVGVDVVYAQRSISADEQAISVEIPAYNVRSSIHLSTLGVYQGLNAAIAYAAVVELTSNKIIPSSSMQNIRFLRFPGRCEKIADHPTVIVDGAINRQSAHEFLGSVAHLLQHPVIVVTSLPQDKDFRGFLEQVTPASDQIIITRANNPYLHFSDEVIRFAHGLRDNVLDQPDSAEAFRLAIQAAGQEGTICVVGTQSLVRDALIFWGKKLETIWGNSIA